MDSIDILKRKRIGFGFCTKTISVFLITCFVVQDLASAAPEIASRFVPSTYKKIDLEIPQAVGKIKASHIVISSDRRESRNDKLIYLIEDAHTNESAQRNIAKLIEHLVKKDNVKTVFLEAGSGDDSLFDLKKAVNIKTRNQVANKFLKKGWIQGPDYANLISNQDFKLWGVEDKKLYWKEIKLYQSLQRKREDLNAYLDSYDRLVKTLKNKLYNPLLKIFDDQHEAFLKEKLSQTDYLEILEAQRKVLGISGSSFPHLAVLESLKNKELQVDFKKAGQEALHAVNSLSEEDRSDLVTGNQSSIKEMDDRETSVGFYLALEEKLMSSRSERSVVEGSKIPRFGLTASLGMTELFKYFDYLREYQKLSAEEVLKEQTELENLIYKSLLRAEDERLLKKISDNLKILRKVINLKASSKDFESMQSAKSDFDVIQIAGILNRKIMDLESNYEDAIFLKKDLVSAVRQARQFYNIANKRDHAFLRNMINIIASEAKQSQIVSSLSASRNNSFILVAGGYHTEHLQKLLKENQISFISITPRILQETSDKKYESLLLNKPSNSAVGVLPARELVLRSEGSVVNVYESLAGELNKPDYSFHEGSRLARKDHVQASIKKKAKTDIRQYLEKIEGLMKQEPWKFYQESGVDPRVAADVHLTLLDMKRFVSQKLLKFDRTRVKDLEFRKLHAVRHAAEDLYLILEALHNLNARNIKFVRKDNLPNGSKGRMFHFAMQSGEDKSWHQIHIVARQFASSSEQPRFGIRIIRPNLKELSFRIDFSKDKSNGSKNSYYVAAIDLPNSFRALIHDKNSWHRGIRWIADPNVFASLVQNLSSKVEEITQEGSRLTHNNLIFSDSAFAVLMRGIGVNMYVPVSAKKEGFWEHVLDLSSEDRKKLARLDFPVYVDSVRKNPAQISIVFYGDQPRMLLVRGILFSQLPKAIQEQNRAVVVINQKKRLPHLRPAQAEKIANREADKVLQKKQFAYGTATFPLATKEDMEAFMGARQWVERDRATIGSYHANQLFEAFQTMDGKPFVQFLGNYSPIHVSSILFQQGIRPKPGDSILLLGAGTGIDTVFTANRTEGLSDIVAVDIDARAVANTQYNVAQSSYPNRITVFQADLFDLPSPHQETKFSSIYFNIPLPSDDNEEEFNVATTDPKSKTFHTLLDHAAEHLKEGGTLELNHVERPAYMYEMFKRGWTPVIVEGTDLVRNNRSGKQLYDYVRFTLVRYDQGRFLSGEWEQMLNQWRRLSELDISSTQRKLNATEVQELKDILDQYKEDSSFDQQLIAKAAHTLIIGMGSFRPDLKLTVPNIRFSERYFGANSHLDPLPVFINHMELKSGSPAVIKQRSNGSRLAGIKLLQGLSLPDSHTMIYPAPRHDLYAVGEMLDQFPELDISTVVLVDEQFFDEWDTPNNLIYNFRATGFSLDDEEEQKIQNANFSDTKRLEIQALSNRDSEKGKIIKFVLYQADYLDPSLKIQEIKNGFALTLIKHFGFGVDAASRENDGDAIYTRAFKEASPNGFVYLNDTHRPSDQIIDSSSSRVISDTGKKDSRISLVQYVLYQKSGARFAEVSREATLHSTPKGLHLRPSLSLMQFIASVDEHVRIAIQTKDLSQYMLNNGVNFLFSVPDGTEMEITVGSSDSEITDKQLNDVADLIKQYLEDGELANEIESILNPAFSIKNLLNFLINILIFRSSRWDTYVQRMENIFSQPNGSRSVRSGGFDSPQASRLSNPASNGPRLSKENRVLGLKIWDEITRSKDLSSLAIAGKLTALDIEKENLKHSLDEINHGLDSLAEEGYLQENGLNFNGKQQYLISINPHALDQETLEGSRLAKRLDNFSFMKDPLIWVAVLVFTAHLALSAYFRFETPINASTVTPPQDPILLTSDIVNIPKDFLNLTRSLLEGKVSIKASYHDTDFKGIVAFIVLSGASLIIYPWIFLMTRSKLIFNKTLFRLGHILQDTYVKILVAALFAVGASNWVEGIYSQIVYGKPIIINWAKMGHGLGLLNHQDVFLFYGVPALLLRVAYLVYRERKKIKSSLQEDSAPASKTAGSRLSKSYSYPAFVPDANFMRYRQVAGVVRDPSVPRLFLMNREKYDLRVYEPYPGDYDPVGWADEDASGKYHSKLPPNWASTYDQVRKNFDKLIKNKKYFDPEELRLLDQTAVVLIFSDLQMMARQPENPSQRKSFVRSSRGRPAIFLSAKFFENLDLSDPQMAAYVAFAIKDALLTNAYYLKLQKENRSENEILLLMDTLHLESNQREKELLTPRVRNKLNNIYQLDKSENQKRVKKFTIDFNQFVKESLAIQGEFQNSDFAIEYQKNAEVEGLAKTTGKSSRERFIELHKRAITLLRQGFAIRAHDRIRQIFEHLESLYHLLHSRSDLGAIVMERLVIHLLALARGGYYHKLMKDLARIEADWTSQDTRTVFIDQNEHEIFLSYARTYRLRETILKIMLRHIESMQEPSNRLILSQIQKDAESIFDQIGLKAESGARLARTEYEIDLDLKLRMEELQQAVEKVKDESFRDFSEYVEMALADVPTKIPGSLREALDKFNASLEGIKNLQLISSSTNDMGLLNVEISLEEIIELLKEKYRVQNPKPLWIEPLKSIEKKFRTFTLEKLTVRVLDLVAWDKLDRFFYQTGFSTTIQISLFAAAFLSWITASLGGFLAGLIGFILSGAVVFIAINLYRETAHYARIRSWVFQKFFHYGPETIVLRESQFLRKIMDWRSKFQSGYAYSYYQKAHRARSDRFGFSIPLYSFRSSHQNLYLKAKDLHEFIKSYKNLTARELGLEEEPFKLFKDHLETIEARAIRPYLRSMDEQDNIMTLLLTKETLRRVLDEGVKGNYRIEEFYRVIRDFRLSMRYNLRERRTLEYSRKLYEEFGHAIFELSDLDLYEDLRYALEGMRESIKGYFNRSSINSLRYQWGLSEDIRGFLASMEDIRNNQSSKKQSDRIAVLNKKIRVLIHHLEYLENNYEGDASTRGARLSSAEEKESKGDVAPLFGALSPTEETVKGWYYPFINIPIPAWKRFRYFVFFKYAEAHHFAVSIGVDEAQARKIIADIAMSSSLRIRVRRDVNKIELVGWEPIWFLKFYKASREEADRLQSYRLLQMALALVPPGNPRYEFAEKELYEGFVAAREADYEKHGLKAPTIRKIQAPLRGEFIPGYSIRPADKDPNEKLPVMMIFHSFTGRKELSYFDDEERELVARGFEVIRWDLLRHGENRLPVTNALQGRVLIRSIMEYMNTTPGIDTENIHVNGFSFGAYIAWLLFTHHKYSDQIRSFAMESAPIYDTFLRYKRVFLKNRRFLEHIFETGEDKKLRLMVSNLRLNRERIQRLLTDPKHAKKVLVLVSRTDQVVDRRDIRFQERLKGPQVVVSPRDDHYAYYFHDIFKREKIEHILRNSSVKPDQDSKEPNSRDAKIRSLFYGNAHDHLMMLKVFILAFASRFFNYHSNDDKIFEIIKRLYNLTDKLREGLDLSTNPYTESQNQFIQDVKKEIQSYPELFLKFLDYSDSIFVRFLHYIWFEGWDSKRFVQEIEGRQSDAFNLAVLLYFADELKLYYLLPGEWEEKKKEDLELEAFSQAMDRLLENFKYDKANQANHRNRRLLANEDLELVLKRLRETDEFLNARKLNAPASETHQEIWNTLERVYFGDRAQGSRLASSSKEEEIAWEIVHTLKFSITFGRPLHTVREELLKNEILTSYLKTYEAMTKLALKKDRESFENTLLEGMVAGLISLKKISEPYDEEKLSQAVIHELRLAALYDELDSVLSQMRPTLARHGEAWRKVDQVEVKKIRQEIEILIRKLDEEILPAIRAENEPFAYLFPTAEDAIAWDAMKILPDKDNWPGYIENLALFKMKKALLTVLGGGFHTRQGSDRNDLYADKVILTEILPVLDKNLKELSQKDSSSPEYKSLDEETREITALILNALFINPAYNIPEGRDRDSRNEDFSFPTYKNYFDKLMEDLQEFDGFPDSRKVLQAAILRYPELLQTDNPTEVPLYLQFADKRDGAERDQDGQEVAAIFSEFYMEHGGPKKYGSSIQFKHIILPPKDPLIQKFFLERNHDIPRSQLRFLEKIKASMLSGELFDPKWHGGARLAVDEMQDEIEIELKKAFHFYKAALSLREEGYYARALDTVSFAIPILNREGKLASGGDLGVLYERIKLLVDEFVSDTTQLFNSRPFFIPKDYGIRFYSWKDFSKWINNPTLVEKILESIKNQKHSTFEIQPGSRNFLLDKNTIALRSKDGAIEFYRIEANGKISLINSKNMALEEILNNNQILFFDDTHPEFVLFRNILIFRKSKSGQLYIFMLGNSTVQMLDRPMSSEEKKSIENKEAEERKLELEEAKRLADKQFVPYSEDFDTAESILKRIEKFSKAYEKVYLVEAQREAKRLQVRFSEFDNTKDIRKKIKRTKSEYRKTMMSRALKDARQFRIRIGRKDTPGTIWTKILNQEIRQLKRYKAKERALQREFKDHVWSKYRNQKRKALPLHYRYYWSKRQANVAKKKLIHWIYFESGIMWKSGQLKDLADVQDEIKAARKYDARMLKKTRDRAKKRGVPYAEEDSVEVLRTRIILYSSYHREIKLRAEEQAKEVKIKAAHNVEVGVVANRLKKRLKENEKLEARRARLAKLREEAIQEAEAKGIAVLNTDSVFDILDRIQLSDLTVFPKKTILREEMARLRSNKLQEEIRLGEVFLSTRDPKLFRFLERMQEGEEQAELIQLTPRKVAVSGYVSIAMFQSVDSEETKGKVSYSLGASSAGQIVIPVIRRVGSGSFDLEFDVRSRYTGKRYTKSRYDFIRDGQVVIRGPKAQLDRMSDGQREILSGLNRKNLPTYFRNLSLAKIQEFGMTNILDNRKRRHLSFWGNVHLAVPSNINSGSVRVEITQEKKKGDYVANLWLVKKGMPKLLLDSVYLTQDGEILDHYVLGPFLDIYRDIGNMPSTSKIEDATEDYFDIDFLARGKGNPSAHSIHLKSGEDRIYYFNESTQAVALGMDFEEEGYTTRQAVKLEDDSRGYEYKNYRNGEVHAYAVYKIFYLNEFHKPELVKRYPSKPTERKKEALQSKLDETLLILAESGSRKLSASEFAERMKEPVTKRQIQRILGLLVRQQLAKATRGKSAAYELTQQGIKRAELLKSSGSRLAAEAPNSKASYIRGRLRLLLDQLERAPFNFELPEKRPITIADISDKIKVARQTLRRHLRLSPSVKKLWDDIYTQAKTIFDQKTETKNSTAAQKLDQRIILQAKINQRLNENPNRIARESTVTTIAEALKIDRHIVARRMKASDEVAKAVQSAYLDKTKAKLINTIRRINNQNEKAESKAGIIFISLQPVNLSRESGLDERFVNKSIRQDARVRREIERGVVLTPMQAKLLTAARDLWLKNRAREFYEPLTLQTVSALAGLDKTGFQRYRRIDSKFRKLSDRYLLSGREAIFLNAILETKDLSFVLEPESQKNKDRVVLRKKTHLSESSIRKLASSNRVRREIRWKYRQLQRQFIMTLRQVDLDLDSAASFLRSSNKDEVRRLIDLSTKNLDELSNHAVKYQWDTTEIARLYKKLNKLDKLSKGARLAAPNLITTGWTFPGRLQYLNKLVVTPLIYKKLQENPALGNKITVAYVGIGDDREAPTFTELAETLDQIDEFKEVHLIGFDNNPEFLKYLKIPSSIGKVTLETREGNLFGDLGTLKADLVIVANVLLHYKHERIIDVERNALGNLTQYLNPGGRVLIANGGGNIYNSYQSVYYYLYNNFAQIIESGEILDDQLKVHTKPVGTRLADFKGFKETILKNKAKGAFIVLPIILEAFNVSSPADKEQAIGILNQHGYFFAGNSEQGVTYTLTGARLGSSVGVQVAPRSLPLNTTWSGSSITSFFSGVGIARAEEINGAELPLELEKTYIFKVSVKESKLVAEAEGGVRIELDLKKPKVGDAKSEPESKISIADLRQLAQSINSKIDEDLKDVDIQASKTVILKIDLGFLDNPSYAIYIDELLRVLNQFKNSKEGENVFFQATGKENLVQYALNSAENKSVLTQNLPGDLKDTSVVAVSPTTSGTRLSAINIPVESFTEGDLPVFRAIIKLAIFAGRIDLSNIPDKFRNAYSTLTGKVVESQILQQILKGLASLEILKQFALRAITKVPLQQLFQFFRMQKKIETSA